jgi:hypothetical protein
MRVPFDWLRSYCDPGMSAAEVADVLTLAGVKLERLHRTGVGDPAAFLTGRVLRWFVGFSDLRVYCARVCSSQAVDGRLCTLVPGCIGVRYVDRPSPRSWPVGRGATHMTSKGRAVQGVRTQANTTKSVQRSFPTDRACRECGVMLT